MKDASACAKQEARTQSTPFHEAITRLRTRVILRQALTFRVWSLYSGYAPVKKWTEVDKAPWGGLAVGSKLPRTLHVAV